jgi:sn-glycerol 3-phosphate transport system permease protein
MMDARNTSVLETVAAWILALLWILPLAFAFWAAFHLASDATGLRLTSPLILDNFRYVWSIAPFPTYFLNTFMLVSLILVAQIVFSALAGYAFARYEFPFKGIIFATILLQLMIAPEALIVENYRTINLLGMHDSVLGMAVPYFASAFGIFLMRQTFKSIPKELDDAAVVEGATSLQVLLKVYIPLARPTLLAYGLVSVSYHWNNFLWPLIVSNSVETRPLTVGLQVFSSVDQGINWSVISAATLLSVAPLLIAFLLFQRQFVQSFLRAGIR